MPSSRPAPSTLLPTGEVLLYRTSDYTGTPAAHAPLDTAGRFSVRVAPGVYYLATTAARYNGVPCRGDKPVSAYPGASTEQNVACQIK